jgi:hypothetical protein
MTTEVATTDGNPPRVRTDRSDCMLPPCSVSSRRARLATRPDEAIKNPQDTETQPTFVFKASLAMSLKSRLSSSRDEGVKGD